jgi:hydrogenase nickel incorporation protein HypB
MKISVEKAVTSANDAVADALRNELKAKGIYCVNMVSAPGSGKTTLIEETLIRLKGKAKAAVVEGDPHTDLDSRRVRAAGGQAVQINTQGGCHLDATMIRRAVATLDLSGVEILFIENVGNLLCPGPWDLGENLRVVVTSLPEGADKALKYPEIFLFSHVLVINKIDLEGIVKTKTAEVRQNALSINAGLMVFELSCETGVGLDSWCDWLLHRRQTPENNHA